MLAMRVQTEEACPTSCFTGLNGAIEGMGWCVQQAWLSSGEGLSGLSYVLRMRQLVLVRD
jgi:hypothetical protein